MITIKPFNNAFHRNIAHLALSLALGNFVSTAFAVSKVDFGTGSTSADSRAQIKIGASAISYYDGLGVRMREEVTVEKEPNSEQVVEVSRIYVDKTNELRECLARVGPRKNRNCMDWPAHMPLLPPSTEEPRKTLRYCPPMQWFDKNGCLYKGPDAVMPAQ